MHGKSYFHGCGKNSYTVLTALIGERKVDAVFTTNIGFADKIRQIMNFSEKDEFTRLLRVFTLSGKDYSKYELNYSYLGREVAENLIKSIRGQTKLENHIMDNDGQRNGTDRTEKTRDEVSECIGPGESGSACHERPCQTLHREDGNRGKDSSILL